MSITSLNDIVASAKQKITFTKTASKTAIGVTPTSMFDVAGNPGAGTMAIGNTTNGVVPATGTNGYPIINAFGGGAVGYIGGVEYSGLVAMRLGIYDRLFAVGAIGFAGGTTTLSSQPAISGRCPDYPGSGTVFGAGNQIWLEVVTAFTTGTAWTVQVTYTNSAGTTGRTSIISSSFTAANLIQGRMYQFALQAGDNGVQKIETVIVTNGGTAMTAGTFNICILRPLWNNRISAANYGYKDDFTRIGLPVIYATSALFVVSTPDSTSANTFDMVIDIWNN